MRIAIRPTPTCYMKMVRILKGVIEKVFTMSQGNFPFGWTYKVETIHKDDTGWSGALNCDKVGGELKASGLGQMEKKAKEE
jgi:hypothetical protein